MVATNADRFFVQGSTVHFRVRVSEPGTKTPASATVILTALRHAGVEVPVTVTAFTQVQVGDYALSMPTATLAPGSYDVVITISDGPSKVTILTDRFAVKTI